MVQSSDYASKHFTTEEVINGCIYLIIILVSIYIIGNILLKKEKHIIKFANKFLEQFNNSLENVPSANDIERFIQNIGYEHITYKLLKKIILFPLLNNKIIFIHNMDIIEKYRIFYTNNTSEISLGKLSIYNIIPGDFYDMLYSDIALNELMSYNHAEIKLIYSNNDDIKLNICFNQKVILQDILLKAFLETGKDNEYVKTNIIQGITNNITDGRNKLLLDVIIDTIKNHKIFKETFLEIFKPNKTILDIIKQNITDDL